MCSIIGSFNIDEIRNLIDLNSSRGQSSYSIGLYNIETNKIETLFKGEGEFNHTILKQLNIQPKHYIICHIQAPTLGVGQNRSIHPSIIDSSYLYHNGQLTQNQIELLKERYNVDSNWDTGLLHHYYLNNEDLSDIDGSFGLLFINKDKVNIMTSNMINLYINKDLTLSSTYFKNSTKIDSNIIYELDFDRRELNRIDDFNSKTSPYFIPDP
jgi:hypothetical protein